MNVQLLRTDIDKVVLHRDNLEATIPFFSEDVLRHRTYLAAFEEEAVVGLACFVEQSRYAPNAIGIAFISTHMHHRNKGVAKALVRSLFELASQEKRNIVSTPYEADGERWLKKVLLETAENFPNVKFFERD